MNRVSAPLVTEEWLDADFDLTDDEPLRALDPESDKDDIEDWDIEMDLGKTGGAKVLAAPPSLVARSEQEEEEGVSTIKMGTLRPKVDLIPVHPTTIDEDFESAFALPSDLTKLSLRPLSHQSSKNSLEWGDKDQTSSSSQSSDNYSTLGFDLGSTSSTSTSLPETETEDEDEDLEGLVIPSALFDSGSCGNELAKILEKKKAPVPESTLKVSTPDPEDDIEIGLVIDDDADFSPSRLLQNTQHPPHNRQSSLGARAGSISSRPLTVKPTKSRSDRAKSPIHPPPASARQLQKIRLSPSPPPRAQPTRAHSYQALLSAPATSSSSFLAAKSGSLRGQKSHSGLKPISPPPSQKRLPRKASMSSLEFGQSQLPGLDSVPPFVPNGLSARYDAPTASSRAKTHTSSTSRIRGLDYNVPPTRPSTPSSNPAALRLTMPTSSSRFKSRPPISSVFPPSSAATPRATSPIPPRPPSSLSLHSRSGTGGSSTSIAPKVLKKPKRQRLYGDGTELDTFDDLPTDRDKESQYRVQPKGYGNRTAGPPREKSIEIKDSGKGTIRKKSTRTLSMSGSGSEAPSRTLKRTGKIELPPKLSAVDRSPKRKKVAGPSNQTRRKPTLIPKFSAFQFFLPSRNDVDSVLKPVGEMRWNPQTLRWEGNDQALREFDVAMAPTRPALITHLTGSSIGSPVGNFASGARRVGNMIFDPGRMCWISTLSPEEEPDVFADMADDEEDADVWEKQGGTIRAGQSRSSSSGLTSEVSSSTVSSQIELPSPARSRARSPSDSGSDRGSRASMVYDVDDTFLDSCRLAEERHRQEIRGWKGKFDDPFPQNHRSYLYEIRALATRRY
ncbi:hypothetical protein EDB83DRAFT_2503143 [Lactarius deliciosus]|nr:hypothetical protein EDB83DRAFT_2503143 [Lactarius deliciosus]